MSKRIRLYIVTLMVAAVALTHCTSNRTTYNRTSEESVPGAFSPLREIRYDVGDTCHVTLVLYNIRGEIVDTLVNKTQGPGEYRVQIGSGRDGRRLESGVYFYKYSCAENTVTKKLIIM